MKIQTSEAFILNLKMMYHDMVQTKERAKRMWSSVGTDDTPLLEQLERDIENILGDILNRLDKS